MEGKVMKHLFMKRSGFMRKAVCLALTVTLICVGVVSMTRNVRVEAAPGDNPRIIWMWMQRELKNPSDVFGYDLVLYFVRNTSGPPAYCIDFDKDADTAPGYVPLALSTAIDGDAASDGRNNDNGQTAAAGAATINRDAADNGNTSIDGVATAVNGNAAATGGSTAADGSAAHI